MRESWHVCTWWLHQPDPVLDNSDYNLLNDFNIFTDHRIMAWHLDLVLMGKQLNCIKLIDFTCEMVVEKHSKKMEKYLGLAVEL